MRLRLSAALLILAAIATPIYAQSLSVSLIGEAFPVDGSTQIPTPFDITFALDPLSGSQSYVFNTTPCMQIVQVSGASITNFNATLGGHAIASAPSLLANISGTNESGTCPGGFQFDLVTSQFSWDFFGSPVPTKTQFGATTDPLASMLLNFDYNPGSDGGLLEGEWNLDVTSVAVPEPGILELMGFAVLCAACITNVRRWRTARARSASIATAPDLSHSLSASLAYQ